MYFFRPPVGIELRSMTKRSDIEKAFGVWPFRSRSSLEFLIRQSKMNLTVGAFTTDGTLVAWIFRYALFQLEIHVNQTLFGHLEFRFQKSL